MSRHARATVLTLTALLAMSGPSVGAAAERSPSADRSAMADRAAGPSRAMWVWTTPKPRRLVSWAARHRVGTLYLSVPPDLPASDTFPWAEKVSRRAHAQGITVQALGSATEWIDDHDGAVAWQEAALGTGLFDGTHLDVEPPQHPDWDSQKDRTALFGRWLEMLRVVQAASPLPLEADIAFWLHGYADPDGRPVDEAAMAILDGVTVMTYRTKVTGADSITGLGAQALAIGAAADIPVRLAVETAFLGKRPVDRKQTFHGYTRKHLNTALTQVDVVEADQAAYAGMAVHHYRTWRAMPKSGKRRAP